MPVRLRITILFALLVFIILGLVCGTVYYISYSNRANNVKTRLTNRAITTARLLSQSEIFNYDLVRRIDASTTMTLKEKTVQAYDSNGRLLYNYTETRDSFYLTREKLDEAIKDQKIYFTEKEKEIIVYHFEENNYSAIMVVSAVDEEGRAK